MTERIVSAGGLDIWTEDVGDPAAPTILLVMGAAQQAIVWPDELVDVLVAGGRHVIRYDHRDVGRSTTVVFETNPYTIDDLAGDALAVLDEYGVQRAHLVGSSMGGMIVQAIALAAPDRVRTLTSIMSTPLAGGYLRPRETGLPGPDQRVLRAVNRHPEPPATDDDRVERAVELRRAVAGRMAPFDEPRMRDLERRILARATDIDAAGNHMLAMAASPDRTARLARITVPALVIHGTADPLVPFAHGQATADAIPGATLLPVDGLGHEFPPAAIPILARAILDHTA